MTHFKKILFFIVAVFFVENSYASLRVNHPLSFDDLVVDPPLNSNIPMHISEEPGPTIDPSQGDHFSDSEDSHSTNEEKYSHTIRISAQVLSQDTWDIFQYCSILLPDGSVAVPDLNNIENGRISIHENFEVSELPNVAFTLIGNGPYEGLSEPILFRIGTKLFQKAKIIHSDGRPLCAVRVNLEIRELRYDTSKNKFFSFLRATGRKKYGEKERTCSTVRFDEFTVIAPKNTFGNDSEILGPIRNRFVCHNNLNRESTYTNVDDDSSDEEEFKSLSTQQTLAISSYVIQATDKYKDITSEDWDGLLSLLVHYNLINRLQVDDVRLFFKTRYISRTS